MAITDIISALDSEIKRLQQVRDLLQTLLDTDMRPWLAHPNIVIQPKRKRKRTMSAEGRKRIADAQRKRWAKQKANPKTH